jgi:hypothetical protein
LGQTLEKSRRRNHAYLVFDTLYGIDTNWAAQPQMVEGHKVEEDGLFWTLTLRDGLRFHDKEPVLARDVVASIRRFTARINFAGALMAATEELSAPEGSHRAVPPETAVSASTGSPGRARGHRPRRHAGATGGDLVPADALTRTAQLFRSFGEDCHERKLEEAYIFPAVKKAGGPAAGYADVLKAQHDRGREVTEYILAVTGKGIVGTGNAEPLARALESFVLMYENHAAREDTIAFPAWKEALSEQALGLADLAQFTAPPPPKA